MSQDPWRETHALHLMAPGQGLQPRSPAHQAFFPSAQAFFLPLEGDTLVSVSRPLQLLLPLGMYGPAHCHPGLKSEFTSSEKPSKTALTKAPSPLTLITSLSFYHY